MPAPRFEEVQLAPPWVFVLLFGGVLGALWAGVRAPGWGAAAPVFATALLLALLAAGAWMRTTVDGAGVHLRALVVIRRHIPFGAIVAAEPRRYRPLAEFGGWGLRRGRRGWAWTMRGDRGVELTLSDGRRLLIGSARPEALAEAIAPGPDAPPR